ncbi:MAG: TIGR03790 family protein [Tepidisphaeraceae bacterium]
MDSELALVCLPDFARHRWQINPLNFKTPGNDGGLTLMVSRIDAPTAELAGKIIDDSVAVEAKGLHGVAVFDSRGKPLMVDGKPDGYGIFDQAIRDAATFFKTKTKLLVVTDDREALIPPHDPQTRETSLYCGWYSLRQYIPSCHFVRGAVAYHVASYELLSMHDTRRKRVGAEPHQGRRRRDARRGRRAVFVVVPTAERILSAAGHRKADARRGVLGDVPDDELENRADRRPALPAVREEPADRAYGPSRAAGRLADKN